ncbi:hypothetical protein [Nodosilinea nodulosa]|uniref:hypothetical protein n=1 Tax=Nodosilinea nodulosa TaxID=416001 RepID=UPI0002F04F48|nr:hypothetical protein [Nodosilinea nodulosa]
MSSYPLSLPSDLLEEIRQLAADSGVSLDQWLVAAIAEKVGAARTERLLRRYAEKFDEEQFAQLLARVPDVDPLPGDEPNSAQV